MKDLGLLTLRLTTGGLLAGHGLQKLVGAFGGPGRKGTAGFMESLGLKPGQYWGLAAGLAETSGALMALGLFEPLGEIGVISAMTMASLTVHSGKPIWVTEGGAELPVTNIAAATSLILTGPGRLSLDSLLGTRLPRPLALLALLGAAGSVAYGVQQARQAAAQQEQGEVQGGGEQQTQGSRNGAQAAQSEPRDEDEPLVQSEAESATAHMAETPAT
jgi:putative oxidoreductase